MTIQDAQYAAWLLAEEKGFHDGRSGAGRDDTMVRLALLHTEVSEATQLVKRHFPDNIPHINECGCLDVGNAFSEELADILIRLLDLAGCTGVDLQSAYNLKMAINARRPHNYGTPKEATR